MSRSLVAPIIVALAALPACTLLDSRSPFGEVPAARRVDAHLEFLASDAMGGRDTGTVHGDITGQYVAAAFRSAGLEPGAGESYLQTYPLLAATVDMDGVGFRVETVRTAVDFEPLEQFVARGYDTTGYDVSGSAVFAGHGIVDAEEGIDDYAGLDVEGRFVLVLYGRPEGHDELRMAASWRAKRNAAQERGALGLVMLDTSARMMGMARHSMKGREMSLGGDRDETEPPFPRVYATSEVGEAIFSAAGKDFEAEKTAREKEAGLGGFELAGVELDLSVAVDVESLASTNAVGVLPGSDPALSDEYIVLSAHMDHVGIGDDGAIHNGADDNATGTTTLMVAAEVLAHGPPLRRSVLFLGVSGEEKGLLGSEWWVNEPTVPFEGVVANVNMDMVGRNQSRQIGVTPSPSHEAYNSMVPKAVELGEAAGLDVVWSAGEGRFRRRVDDYFRRSDHANFTEKGVPAIFFFAGEHEDYHQPSDTLEKVDRAKVVRVVDLVTRLVRDIADAGDAPMSLPKEGAEAR